MNLIWIFSLIAVIGFLANLIYRTGKKYAELDWGHPLINWFDGWNRFYCRKIHGLHGDKIQLPEGPILLICNHMSALDPLILCAATNRPLRFIVAKEEYQKPYFNWLMKPAGCIPVDRNGRVEKAFREAIRQLEQGEVVALFPHGGMHLDDAPFKPLKRGVFRLAQMVHCPIYCYRLTGIRYPGSTVRSLVLPASAKVEYLRNLGVDFEINDDIRKAIGLMLLGKEKPDLPLIEK